MRMGVEKLRGNSAAAKVDAYRSAPASRSISSLLPTARILPPFTATASAMRSDASTVIAAPFSNIRSALFSRPRSPHPAAPIASTITSSHLHTTTLAIHLPILPP
jgi:hypothetical protein